MKERSILFNAQMVKAILDGRKTQTRRVVKDPRKKLVNPPSSDSMGGIYSMGDTQRELELTKDKPPNFPCPYGQAGDRLWVRETWYTDRLLLDRQGEPILYYKASDGESFKWFWKSPRFMPRWVSRIDLEITEVRVERVQAILPSDCVAEGTSPDIGQGGHLILRDYISPYARLWNLLNAKRGYGWETNPWVWVILFKRIN